MSPGHGEGGAWGRGGRLEDVDVFERGGGEGFRSVDLLGWEEGDGWCAFCTRAKVDYQLNSFLREICKRIYVDVLFLCLLHT